MTATILLIRHAAHGDLGSVLSGRRPGIPLSGAGRDQARALAAGLASAGLDLIQSSPVQRARETAEEIAACSGLPVEIAPALDEIDFGAWTGRSFAELEADPQWVAWNSERSRACPPMGEPMAAAQARALAHLHEVVRRCPDKTVAMVSHCDIIRAVVAGVLGLSLDHLLRFDVDTASVTRIVAGDWGARLVSLNRVY